GSENWYCTAKCRSTRLTSDVSTRDLKSLEFTLATFTMLTLSNGQGRRKWRPGGVTSRKRPKRCTTPRSGCFTWYTPLYSHTTTTAAMPMMSSELLSPPRPPPVRRSDSSLRCQLLRRSSRSGPPGRRPHGLCGPLGWFQGIYEKTVRRQRNLPACEMALDCR